MLDFQAARFLMDGDVPHQAGTNHPTSIPTGVFKTKDGHMNLAVAGQEIWKRFAHAMGRDDWIEDARYATAPARSDTRDALGDEIDAITATRTTAEWIDIMNEAGVPAGEINDIGQVFDNPQVHHLGLSHPVTSHERGDTHVVGQPIIMSRTPSTVASPLPLAGQHSTEILKEIGYSDSDIDAMKAQSAI